MMLAFLPVTFVDDYLYSPISRLSLYGIRGEDYDYDYDFAMIRSLTDT